MKYQFELFLKRCIPGKKQTDFYHYTLPGLDCSSLYHTFECVGNLTKKVWDDKNDIRSVSEHDICQASASQSSTGVQCPGRVRVTFGLMKESHALARAIDLLINWKPFYYTFILIQICLPLLPWCNICFKF